MAGCVVLVEEVVVDFAVVEAGEAVVVLAVVLVVEGDFVLAPEDEPVELGAFRSCAATVVPSFLVYSLTWTVFASALVDVPFEELDFF